MLVRCPPWQTWPAGRPTERGGGRGAFCRGPAPLSTQARRSICETKTSSSGRNLLRRDGSAAGAAPSRGACDRPRRVVEGGTAATPRSASLNIHTVRTAHNGPPTPSATPPRAESQDYALRHGTAIGISAARIHGTNAIATRSCSCSSQLCAVTHLRLCDSTYAADEASLGVTRTSLATHDCESLALDPAHMCSETPGHMYPPSPIRCASSPIVDLFLVVHGLFFEHFVESCFSRDGDVHLGACVAAEVVGGVSML